MADAKLDANRKASLIVVSNADDDTPVRLWADPTTHRLLTNTTVAIAPSTSGGLLLNRNINLSVTGQVIKATAGQLYGWFMYNNANTVRYVKFYNKATAPSSADTPVLTIPIPPGSGTNVEYSVGVPFATGVSMRASTGVADNDNTAPDANDVIVNIFYY